MPPRSATSPPDEPDAVIAAAADFLVRYSDRAWVPMLAEHADNGSGRCATCRGPAGSHWPCTMWAIARHAEVIARRRAPDPR